MVEFKTLDEVLKTVSGYATVRPNAVEVKDWKRFREEILDTLAWNGVFGPQDVKDACRWIVKTAALESGLVPSSIHALYAARGKGHAVGFTVPAMNIRGLTYDKVRAAVRAAKALDAGAFIFELARTEMQYTEQPPTEYAFSVIAGALREGYTGPLFIQGDHFQVKAARYFGTSEEREKELTSIRSLIEQAVPAGFYNIDIDTSTLVVLERPTVPEQQKDNYETCAQFTHFIRKLEPAGVTISVGGEIGEVGHKNTTVEELRAFMDGFRTALRGTNGSGLVGISNLSVNTGTSHGGVPLPDGTIAQVKLDFEAVRALSTAAQEYGLGGAVQHGASTLPEELFTKFPETATLEIHLATEFQNIVYNHPLFPKDLHEEIKAHCLKAHADERKPSDTDTQHFYKTRKKSWGPFKRKLWSLDRKGVLDPILADLERKFVKYFSLLGIRGTRKTVQDTVRTVKVPFAMPAALAQKLQAAAGA